MRTSNVQIVMASHVNGANRLFGGKLMEWIDIAAAVEARRHAHNDVTLAAVDALEFIAPVHMNDTIVLQAEVTWTGHTSMEVRVEAFAEYLTGERVLVNRAYLVFVAMDESDHPRPVPPFVPQTPEERAEWQNAVNRRAYRMARRHTPDASGR